MEVEWDIAWMSTLSACGVIASSAVKLIFDFIRSPYD